MNASQIQLGQDAKDTITGYAGIVMAKAQYLTGCNQVLLTPRSLDKDGKRREGEWFDEQRIVVTSKKALAFHNDNPGADEPSAPRR
jgi:hypothetical protein